MRASSLASIIWDDAKPEKAVKELCTVVFGREVLRTHSLTGKISNAHKGRIAKPALDTQKVQDLIGKSYIVIDQIFKSCFWLEINHFSNIYFLHNYLTLRNFFVAYCVQKTDLREKEIKAAITAKCNDDGKGHMKSLQQTSNQLDNQTQSSADTAESTAAVDDDELDCAIST